MKSVERVKAAIKFNCPDCFPIINPDHPEVSDVVFICLEPKIWCWHEVSPGVEECTDFYGCTRRRMGGQGIGEVIVPLIDDLSYASSYTLPDANNLENWIKSEAQLPYEDKFVIGDFGFLLYKIFEICGHIETLMGVLTNPGEVAAILDTLSEYACKRVDLYVSTGRVHGISVFDDWGTQENLMISPDIWRKLFFEPYRKVFTHADEAGLNVFFHSCGAVGPIVPDLINAGVNVLMFDQPRVHNVESLWERFGGKVAFACPVDIQQTLPTRDRKRIRCEAEELVAALHHNGGYLALVNTLYWEEQIEGSFDLAEFQQQVFEELRTRS